MKARPLTLPEEEDDDRGDDHQRGKVGPAQERAEPGREQRRRQVHRPRHWEAGEGKGIKGWVRATLVCGLSSRRMARGGRNQDHTPPHSRKRCTRIESQTHAYATTGKQASKHASKQRNVRTDAAGQRGEGAYDEEGGEEEVEVELGVEAEDGARPQQVHHPGEPRGEEDVHCKCRCVKVCI